MPGLLQSNESGLASLKFVAAFFAELIGVLIFTLYGSAVGTPNGPWGNGITLAVLGTWLAFKQSCGQPYKLDSNEANYACSVRNG